jgi:hypothetical protein
MPGVIFPGKGNDMVSLTESMTRLRNDVTASRNACIQFVGQNDVTTMQSIFQKGQADLATYLEPLLLGQRFFF